MRYHTETNRDMQHNSKRWKPSLALAACLAISVPNLSSSFLQTRKIRIHGSTPKTKNEGKLPRASRISSRRFFRVGEDVLPYLEPSATSNILNNVNIGMMPIWLRQNKGEQLIELFDNLKAMATNSHMTWTEVNDIIALIHKFGEGDSNKIAGATQLCLILVETMDMGYETLVASVIHFFSCLDERERAHFLPRTEVDFFTRYIDVIETYGEGVKTIVNDAATLKMTEMKASSLIQISDAGSLRSLLLAESGDWRALAIRSAAALFRLSAIEEMKSCHDITLTPEDKRVAKEALHIYAPLASSMGFRLLKEELEGTAFRVLYKRQHEKVTAMMKKSRMKDGMQNKSSVEKIANIQDSLTSIEKVISGKLRILLEKDEMFKKYAENVVVSARVKEPFSLWRKMVKKGIQDIVDMPDALALRITFDAKKESPDEDIEITRARERALCYYVKKLCTEKWRPDSANPRFKDYIKNPKKNGYQSLHYTAKTEFNGDDWLFEIQVRSGEMHRVAEYGLASHWDYKLQGNGGNDDNKNCYQPDNSSEAYLKFAQEWYWKHGNTKNDSSPSPMKCGNFNISAGKNISKKRREKVQLRSHYIKHLSTLRSKLTRNQVMVFLSPSEGSSRYFDGKILSLPSGSCIIDALKEGEKQFGITTNFWGLGVARNGYEATLTQRLTNGDVLNIPATSGKNVFSV